MVDTHLLYIHETAIRYNKDTIDSDKDENTGDNQTKDRHHHEG